MYIQLSNEHIYELNMFELSFSMGHRYVYCTICIFTIALKIYFDLRVKPYAQNESFSMIGKHHFKCN